MKFITIPHELMPARANVNKKELASTIAEIEGWGYKDIVKIGKIAALRGWNYKNLTKLPKNSEGGLIKFNPSISLLKQSKNFCDYLMWYRATQPCKTTGALNSNKTENSENESPFSEYISADHFSPINIKTKQD